MDENLKSKLNINVKDKSVPKYKLAGIYQGLVRLRHEVRKMTFCMSKTDRRMYGDEAMRLTRDCIENFVIAYDFIEERPQHYVKLCGVFHVLQTLIDEIDMYHVLRVPAKEEIQGNNATRTSDRTSKPDSVILRIYEEMAKIDEQIAKWRNIAMQQSHTTEKSKQ